MAVWTVSFSSGIKSSYLSRSATASLDMEGHVEPAKDHSPEWIDRAIRSSFAISRELRLTSTQVSCSPRRCCTTGPGASANSLAMVA